MLRVLLLSIILSCSWGSAYGKNRWLHKQVTGFSSKISKPVKTFALLALLTCNLQACVPSGVHDWYQGKGKEQRKVRRVANGLEQIMAEAASDAETADHVIGSDHRLYIGRIVGDTTGSYIKVEEYDGNTVTIEKNSIQGVLLDDQHEVGTVRSIPTEVVGIDYEVGKILGVYYNAEFSLKLYLFSVEWRVDFAGEVSEIIPYLTYLFEPRSKEAPDDQN